MQQMKTSLDNLQSELIANTRQPGSLPSQPIPNLHNVQNQGNRAQGYGNQRDPRAHAQVVEQGPSSSSSGYMTNQGPPIFTNPPQDPNPYVLIALNRVLKSMRCSIDWISVKNKYNLLLEWKSEVEHGEQEVK